MGYFEEELPSGTTYEIRGLDAEGNSIVIPLSEFLLEITEEAVVLAIIEASDRAKGIRTVILPGGESWGAEEFDSDTKTWNATGFEEPL